jgi:transcription-repair coupling factor (superfamily II helicase)
MEIRPLLVVVAREGRALDLVEELQVWLGAEASRRLRLFPQHDRIPYKQALEDRWDSRDRLDVIATLARGEAIVVVASAEAIAQPTLSAAAARAGVWTLKVGDPLTPEELLRRFLSASAQRTSAR